MTRLDIKPRSECRWDCVSLGEVMLRLDPAEGRISTTRSFRVWEGGGEYNVARGLKRCFGLNTTIVTALADNPIGRLVEDLMYQGGVDQSHVLWKAYDGVGRTTRNGLNFVERGYGVRAALGCSDRGHTAVSQLQPGDIDWDHIFGEEGARWFHTGGIFCALSENTAEVAKEAMRAAKKHGTIVSYDLNYRESLWNSRGGPRRASELNRELAAFVDVMLGDPSALGFDDEEVIQHRSDREKEKFKQMIAGVFGEFDHFKVIAATLRHEKTATLNAWGAICYYDGVFFESQHFPTLEILDRIGGGDSFASGLIYGFLNGADPQWAVECGAAHGALAMTTPGDTTMVTLPEVERLMKGSGARVSR